MSMNEIRAMREKRVKLWEAAKAFVESRKDANGTLSAEDSATYDQMEADVIRMGKEIERLERQEALDLEFDRPTARTLTDKPIAPEGKAEKTGRASDAYKAAFWRTMRDKAVPHEVLNALQVGTDSEGGYLVPDEYERTLIESLEEENIFRRFAHIIRTSSGDRKIPIVVSKGTASWIDEEAAYPESDDAFGQTSISAYKLATMIKVSDAAARFRVRCGFVYRPRVCPPHRRCGRGSLLHGQRHRQTYRPASYHGRRGGGRDRQEHDSADLRRGHGSVLQPPRPVPPQRCVPDQ